MAEQRASLHVCIVGAGIVGIASSILFRRNGLRVTVLEKDASLHARPAAGIQLHPNALRVLQDIGVYDKMLAKSVATKAIILKQYASGKTLHSQDLVPALDRYGAPVVTVHRGHVRQVLYDEAVALGVEFRFGINVKICQSDMDAGVLRLDGQELLKADLFVGADGAYSGLREAIIGRKPRSTPHGKVVHRIVLDEALIRSRPSLRHLVDATSPSIVVWLGPQSQAVTYSLDGVFNIAFTRPYAGAPFYGPQGVHLEGFRAEVASEGWHGDVVELIGLGTECQRWMFVDPEIDDQDTPWVDPTGVFCLVGDAAHQTLPYLAQGAAIGLESASVLARLLSRAESPEQRKDSLHVYQRLRQERTGHVIRASLKNGSIWQLPNGPLQEERDRELLHGVPSAGFPNLLADPFFQRWLWGYDARGAADEAWDEHLRRTDSRL